MFKWIAGVAATLTVLGALWGAGSWFDCRYAKAQDHQLLKQTVQDKVDSDHLRLLRERKWQMEREFPNVATRPASIASQIKVMELQEKVLDQRLGPRELPQ
jgi:hypothetical protein